MRASPSLSEALTVDTEVWFSETDNEFSRPEKTGAEFKDDTTSAVPQTHTYSKEPPQFKVNIFQPSASKMTCSVPEPDLLPDQAPEAVQLAAEEDQVSVTVDPFGVFSVLEENSAEIDALKKRIPKIINLI